MIDVGVNYLAVFVAALVNFVVGWLWYGPLFGKMWKSLMGFTDESIKNMKMKPMVAMFLGFVSSLIMACVLARLLIVYGAYDLTGAWSLAFLVWIGFLVTTSASGYLWEGKPLKLFVLNIAYQLVAVFLTAVVLVLFG
jgi:hypothetical protein